MKHSEEFKNFCFGAYGMLVNGAYGVISDEVCADARKYYKREENFKKASLMWKLKSAIFSLSPKYWEEDDKDYSGRYTSRYLIAKRYAEEFPEFADRTLGFCELFSAVNFMRSVCENTNKEAAVDYMKSFYELLNSNPGINDIDLLIGFIKKEHVVKKVVMRKIDLIPSEAKENVNLHIKERLNSISETFYQGFNS